MRRLILVILMVVMLLQMPLSIFSGEITEAQVVEWWEGLPKETRIKILTDYVTVMNDEPVIKLPEYMAIVSGNSVIIKPDSNGVFMLGGIEYELKFSEIVFDDIVPECPEPAQEKFSLSGYVITGLVSFLAGAITFGVLAR